MRLLLMLGIFTIPFSFDYTLFDVSQEEHRGWASGIIITLSDVFFILLFVLWKIKNFKLASPPKKVLFSLPIVLFLCACIFSVPLAEWRAYCYFEIIQYCKIVFLYYYVTMLVIQNKDDMRAVTLGLMVMLLFQSILAIVQFQYQDFYNVFHSGKQISATQLGDLYRSHGTVGQPNSFAALLIPLLLLNQVILCTERKNKILYVLLYLIGLLAMFFSFSRNGWMTLLLISIVLFMKYKGKSRPTVFILPIAALMCICLLSPDLLMNRLTGDDGGAGQDRFYLMRIAFNIIKNNFAFGIGINNYWYVMNHYVPIDYDWPFIYIVHNLFLLVFAETGVVGIIAIVLMFAIPIVKTYNAQTQNRSTDPYLSWLLASFVAFVVMNQFDYSWITPIMNPLFFVLLGITNALLFFREDLDLQKAH